MPMFVPAMLAIAASLLSPLHSAPGLVDGFSQLDVIFSRRLLTKAPSRAVFKELTRLILHYAKDGVVVLSA